LEDFGVSFAAPTPLLSDTGAISIARDLVKHELIKHISVDASFVLAAVQDQVNALRYVPSKLQLADFFTKASPNSVLFIHHEFEVGVGVGGCRVCVRDVLF
jgi:hypothetical protein